MGALALREVDDGAVFICELGKLDGDGMVDGGAMSDGGADVVREGADGEGEFVGRLSISQKSEDEGAGADVVGEVGEEGVAEGVVSEGLDSAAAVGVGVGLTDLGFGEGGEALEQ